MFFLPSPVEERSDRAALAGTWHPAMVSPPQQRGKANSMVVIYSLQLDSIILKIFSNLHDSMVLWSRTNREQVEVRQWQKGRAVAFLLLQYFVYSV